MQLMEGRGEIVLTFAVYSHATVMNPGARPTPDESTRPMLILCRALGAYAFRWQNRENQPRSLRRDSLFWLKVLPENNRLRSGPTCRQSLICGVIRSQRRFSVTESIRLLRVPPPVALLTVCVIDSLVYSLSWNFITVANSVPNGARLTWKHRALLPSGVRP